MKKPNLLILGAQKSGTSWLHSVLKHHPDIFMSDQKEIAWFNQPELIYESRDPAEYFRHFERADGKSYAGESTPAYFWTGTREPTKMPDRVSNLLGPDVRFIAILRCPVSRARSAYQHHFVKGRIQPGQSVFDTPNSLGILDIGQYERHLTAWQSVYPSSNFFLMLYDDLKTNPVDFVDSVLAWLRLPLSQDGRVGGFQLQKKLHVTREMARREGIEDHGIPTLSAEDHARLIEFFEPGVRALERRMGRKLKRWLRPFERSE